VKRIIYLFLLFIGIVIGEELAGTNNTLDEVVLNNTTFSSSVDKKNIATRSDIQVIESSEDIVYISQKMVKDYLLLATNPKNTQLANKLKESLRQLNEDLKMIARTTKNSDTKDLLDYLAYSKDEISEILKNKIDKEQSSLMLDYSETLLEGGHSMVASHQYNFNDEEKMLAITKKVEYLLSRITKYYFAKNLGFDTIENHEQMQASIIDLEENFVKINMYTYPNKIEKLKSNMFKTWQENKRFFIKDGKKVFIPNIIFISMNYLEQIVDNLVAYHRKNQ